MHKTWIEAALNGPWSRQRQPGMPDTVEAIVADGIACAQAGACIIHVHAYDGGGPQTFAWQVYARIIEGIRGRIDVPVYPSIPSAGIGTGPTADDPAQRFAHVEALAARGLLEFAVVDPGSVNFTELSVGRDTPAAPTYLNPEAHVRHGLAFAVRYGFHPAYAIYEPGFTRAGAALARAMGAKTPVYRLMFSDTFAFGLPPRPYALAAHRTLVAEEAPGAPWMIAGLGVDIKPLIGEAVPHGGHVRVGLEDAPFGTTKTNRALVTEAVHLVRAAGAEPATVTEMRAMLAQAGTA
ncbi:MAG TPA: 3-keto-5-aminohexanoate cleavage protein [Hyphomicrobiaceae bacterium]|nr:3-keto-5-aminohexanoate cleavage protein [Hyphomicrobiaceae bacterium]